MVLDSGHGFVPRVGEENFMAFDRCIGSADLFSPEPLQLPMDSASHAASRRWISGPRLAERAGDGADPRQRRNPRRRRGSGVERVRRIELPYSAWEAHRRPFQRIRQGPSSTAQGQRSQCL